MKKIFTKKNAPVFMAVVSVAGLVGTVVTAVYAAPKAEALLKEKEQQKGEPLTKAEKLKYAVPVYIPTILTGTATAVCIFGGSVLSRKQLASLGAGYTLVADQFTRYKNKVREIHGEQAHRDIMEQINCAVCEPEPLFAPGLGLNAGFDFPEDRKQLLFYDPISEIFFKTSYEDVLSVLYHLNRNYMLRGSASCDEYYEFLGIECENLLGWSMSGGVVFLDFDISKAVKDGVEYYRIEPVFWPEPDYDEF